MKYMRNKNKQMKQLDVDVSPSANIMFRLSLINLTFDLDHVTFDPDPWSLALNIACKTAKWDLKSHFWPGDLDL